MIVKEVYLENMSVPIVINYTQGTNNIPIRFKFVDIKLNTSQRVFLYADKVSGNKIYNEAEEVNVNEGYAVFAVTSQMSAEAGRNVMQLRITEHEKVINSFLILFDVASGIYDEDAILSTNEYKALDQALDSAREWENAAEKSATEAKKYSDNAGVYATNAKTSELNAKTYETNAKTSEANAKASEANAKVSETNAKTSETNASASASSAKISETNAKTSETAAKASEVNASVSEANALEYSNNSRDSADASESSAVTSSTHASYSENSAKAAKSSEDKALEYSIVANNSAEEAKSSENNAREHSKDASDSAGESMSYALQAQSYAVGTGGVRDNESEDNSKFYSEKSKEYMNTWKGSLLPKGSVAFENLPTNDIMPGHLYNISNRFVSDDRFKDGLGYSYPAGTNIYYTEDGKWDVLYGILTKEITQAEYDALSESQKKNGTIYYIKDADVEIGSASDSVPGVVLVDGALSSSSKNPVQNKVVTEALNKKLNDSDISSWAKGSTKPTYTASEVGAYTKAETDTKLNGKANSSHTHGNEDIISLDASKIVSGIINIDRLPQGALERLTVVANDTARFKLTSSNVQKGDTVKVTSTGKMYYVVDETKLSSEAGYEIYAAGTAASVPWSGVTGKPNTYTPSEHTHTKSQIVDFPTSMPANGGNSATATKLATARTIQTNLGSTSSAPFDGSANITPGVTGTLPVANGGTGATTAKAAEYNILSGMTEATNNPSDDSLITYTYNGSSETQGKLYWRKASTLWNYIKDKISSVLGLTASAYGGKSATATKLATPRTINDTSFDGSGNIRTANSWNLSLGGTSDGVRYTIFARTSSSNSIGNCGATLLVTDCGNFGGTLPGVWLIQLSNRGSVPTMNVTVLRPQDIGTVTFGYYKDTTNGYFYFGVYTTSYRSDSNITVLRNTGVTIQKFYDNTTAPSGWTEATVRYLQDETHTHPYLPLSGGTLTGKIQLPSSGLSYIDGMTISKASIGISTQNSSDSYHPLLSCKTYNSNVWNLGSVIDRFGFYMYKNGRTTNGIDFRAEWDTATGNFTNSGDITAPTFIGNLTGNASTATKLATARTIALTGSVNGSGTFDGSGNLSIATATNHTHASLKGWADTRKVATKPNDYNDKLSVVGIKEPGMVNSNTTDFGNYVTIMGIRGWGDYSGGDAHEIGFAGNGTLWHRHGGTTSFGSWGKIYTSQDKPTLSELGAAALNHTHNYAGSSSAGGVATNADKLDGYHASDFVRFKSITQAEYDKLTSPESNVIYFITDAS